MDKINILFSSVGRRVELVNAFRKAAKEINVKSILVGCDIDKFAPAMQFVDKKYIVDRIKSDGFINNIIDICKKENIKLIVPTLDTELLLYSENKERIFKESGARVMVSDIDTIKIVRDKIKTCEYLGANGILVPKLIDKDNYIDEDLLFPLFIKPFDGSSSIQNFKVNNLEELKFFEKYVKNPIIQEFANGEEYCVDVFSDFEGNIITATPKLRVAHRGGEITKAKIVKDREIINLAKKIISLIKPSGEVNFDCIKTDKGIYVIEINGRFAGGAPISFAAGADSPKRLYELLQGKNIRYNEEYIDGFMALRFDDAKYILE